MLHLSRGGRRLLAFSSATLIAIALLAVASAGSLAHQRSTHHGVKAAHWKSGGGSISSVPWGTANGTPVNLYTLTNGHGMTVNITNYGGVVQSIWVRDRWGTLRNVALGFPSLSDYVNDFTQGANSTSGRCPADRATRTSARSSADTRTGSPMRSSRCRAPDATTTA